MTRLLVLGIILLFVVAIFVFTFVKGSKLLMKGADKLITPPVNPSPEPDKDLKAEAEQLKKEVDQKIDQNQQEIKEKAKEQKDLKSIFPEQK